MTYLPLQQLYAYIYEFQTGNHKDIAAIILNYQFTYFLMASPEFADVPLFCPKYTTIILECQEGYRHEILKLDNLARIRTDKRCLTPNIILRPLLKPIPSSLLIICMQDNVSSN